MEEYMNWLEDKPNKGHDLLALCDLHGVPLATVRADDVAMLVIYEDVGYRHEMTHSMPFKRGEDF